MTGAPEVSVVLVSWNTRELTLAALASLLPVPGVAAEVIVVDNDSSDGSAEAVTAAFPAVRLLRSPSNVGFGAGANLGIREARAPFVLVLNPDTLVLDDALAALLRYAAAHPEAGILGPQILDPDHVWQPSCFRFPSLANLLLSATYLYKLFPRSPLFARETYGGMAPDAPRAVDAVSGCAFLLRREVIERVGAFDEGFFMYAEELDLCYRARQAGFDVHYAPVGRIVHLGGGASRLQARRMFLEFRRSLLRFHRKHHGPLFAVAARALLALFLLVRLPYWGLRALGPGADAARAQLGNVVAGLRLLLLGTDDAPASRIR